MSKPSFFSIMNDIFAMLDGLNFFMWLRNKIDAFIQGRLHVVSEAGLHRNNIYILPTRYGYLFLILLFVLLLTAINYQNNLIYLFLFMLAALGMSSIIMCFGNLDGIKMTALETQICHAGETGFHHIRLISDSARADILVKGAHNDSYPIEMEKEVPLDLAIKHLEPRRGKHKLDKLYIETRFPFGLLKAWSWQWLDHTLWVYPEIIPESSETAGEGNQNVRSQQLSGDVEQLKPYQPGDSMKAISWKRYALDSQNLLTKYAEKKGKDNTWISYDNWPHLDMEARLSAMASLVDQYEKAGTRYGLRLGSNELALNQGKAHYHQCMRALAMHGK